MALAFALPLGVTWLLPDICAYAIAGFDALAFVVRFAAPVTAVVTFALVARVLKRSFAASLGRVAMAALLGGSLRASSVGYFCVEYGVRRARLGA